MTAQNHYHDRIQKATQQLAQLQVRQLLVSQRRELRAKTQAKRDEFKRRLRVAEIVFLTGAQMLEDSELQTLLHNHMTSKRGTID